MNRLGDIRPSQLIFTFGVGALLDLPNFSGLVMGLDDWDERFCKEIAEDRLLAALQRRFGPQLTRLCLPPIQQEEWVQDPASPPIGVPVAPFPRWLRCPMCNILATIDSGVFQLQQDRFRPDKTRFVHAACTRGNNPIAFSVRFLLACREGHLSDFPWIEYVHQGNVPCQPARLTLREYGAAGDASDVFVECLECKVRRRMGDAFDKEAGGNFACPGHHPHLRLIEQEDCPEPARTILLGASNSWFPLAMSALSIPRATDKLGLLVEARWAELKEIPSLEVLKYAAAPSRMPAFAEVPPEELWEAIQAKRQRDSQPPGEEAEDLKLPEWEALSAALPGDQKDFRLTKVPPPLDFESYFEDTVLVEKVREVRALLGFTRIESKGDFADAAYVEDERQTPLSRGTPTWLPASEVRGEGIFLRLREEVLTAWESSSAVQALERNFLDAHRAWRRLRKLGPEAGAFPGMRYVLLHSLAHALLRQIVLDCGYTAASIRERLYCRLPGEASGPMAGILIYTAATDSEGTLGGLVNLGDRISLARHLQQTLENLRLCASDPLCSEHRPSGDGRVIHGASCHACLFAPETSCERGNRYLDRAVLVPTFSSEATAFFKV